jgi:hypothetical protein
MSRRLWAAAIDNHASGHLSFPRFLRIAEEAQRPPEDELAKEMDYLS